jgi:hypothetical protein
MERKPLLMWHFSAHTRGNTRKLSTLYDLQQNIFCTSAVTEELSYFGLLYTVRCVFYTMGVIFIWKLKTVITGEHGIPGEYNSDAGHQTKSTTPS